MNNQGQLENNSPAELIREIGEKRLSGALRLSNNKAKAVVYCENGEVIFAASNLRAHRLADFLKRSQTISDEKLAALSPKTTDEELLAMMARDTDIKPQALQAIRANHISDMLRGVLLWTSGEWQFDSRVRVAEDTRITIDVKRLLLECARHLPASYLASRFHDQGEILELAKHNGHQARLLPAEGFVLSRVVVPTSLKDLLVISGLTEEETLRAVYGLSLSGLLLRTNWPSVDIVAQGQPLAPAGREIERDQDDDLESFFARVENSAGYYDVLKIGRQSSADQIREAYHALARRFHPDRFHQSDAELRRRVDSAFARIARAYETLGDESARAEYDAQFAERPAPAVPPLSKPAKPETAKDPNQIRAESSFQQGLTAAKNNQPEYALRFFAEAASLDPRKGRYRAEYGRALTSQAQTRRIAEIELKAAIALEPNNGDYRLMLADLYKALGLHRRAAGEIHKALAADPNNETARALLAGLKK